MNKFKVESINPGYGFKNYKIGEITVYTVRLRFKSPIFLEDFKSNKYNRDRSNAVLNIFYIKGYTIISYETTDWNIMKEVRKSLWEICKIHAQKKLDIKYGQTEINF